MSKIELMIVSSTDTQVLVRPNVGVFLAVLQIHCSNCLFAVHVLHQMTQIVVAVVRFPSSLIRIRPDGTVPRWCQCGLGRPCRRIHGICPVPLAFPTEQIQRQQNQEDEQDQKKSKNGRPVPFLLRDVFR